MCVEIVIASHFNTGGWLGHGRYARFRRERNLSRELYQEAGIAYGPIALLCCVLIGINMC